MIICKAVIWWLNVVANDVNRSCIMRELCVIYVMLEMMIAFDIVISCDCWLLPCCCLYLSKLQELVYDVRCCSKLLESYKMCHDVEVVRVWVHAYSFKDEGSCPGAFAQQRWELMPRSFCSIATRAYALDWYHMHDKMIELHSRVRVALSCC